MTRFISVPSAIEKAPNFLLNVDLIESVHEADDVAQTLVCTGDEGKDCLVKMPLEEFTVLLGRVLAHHQDGIYTSEMLEK